MAVLGLGGFATVITGGPASAHTPNVTSTCENLNVNLTQYNTSNPNKTNSVKVTIDGSVVEDTTFGSSFTKSYPVGNKYVNHTYEVAVKAWDDKDGDKGWTKTFSGSTTACNFDWNWTYPAPSCSGLVVTYPGDIPPGNTNDVNIKVKNLVTNEEQTFNFHQSSDWTGTQTFNVTDHPDWPGWTYFAYTWTQVGGSDYHWMGSVTCGNPPPTTTTVTPVDPTIMEYCGPQNDVLVPVSTPGIDYTTDGEGSTNRVFAAPSGAEFTLSNTPPPGWTWNDDKTKMVFTWIDQNEPCQGPQVDPVSVTVTNIQACLKDGEKWNPTVSTTGMTGNNVRLWYDANNNGVIDPKETYRAEDIPDTDFSLNDVLGAFGLPDAVSGSYDLKVIYFDRDKEYDQSLYMEGTNRLILTDQTVTVTIPEPPALCVTNLVCESFENGPVGTDQNGLWTVGDTRSKGHIEYLKAGGLKLWTEDSSSQSKVSYGINEPMDLSSIGELGVGWTKTGGTFAYGPGINLSVDFDNNGTPDGTLVFEEVYGQDLWLTNGSAQFVKDAAPVVGGGNGSQWHGTINQWLSVFPNAKLVPNGYGHTVSFALGSGVYAEGVLEWIQVGCKTYTFEKAIPVKPEPLSGEDFNWDDPVCYADGVGGGTVSGTKTSWTQGWVFDEEAWTWELGEKVYSDPTPVTKEVSDSEEGPCPPWPTDATATVKVTPMACGADGNPVYAKAEPEGVENAKLESSEVTKTDYSFTFKADEGHLFADGKVTKTISGKFNVEVCSHPETPDKPLAYTGADIPWWMIPSAVIAVLLGATLVVVSRLRRRHGDGGAMA